jgi:[protein-PII] uridylyltransferase
LAEYFNRYRELSESMPVVTNWSRNGDLWETLVITEDRPELFSQVTGALSAFGMNVVRAQAFANRRGVAFDIMTFEDPDERLTINPSELERLEEELMDVLTRSVAVEDLLRRRTTSVVHTRTKASVPVEVFFDRSSKKYTIMEIVAPDVIGLLFHISKVITSIACNIEVALVATEGQKATDVFYLTRAGKPLTEEQEQYLRESLKSTLQNEVSTPAG